MTEDEATLILGKSPFDAQGALRQFPTPRADPSEHTVHERAGGKSRGNLEEVIAERDQVQGQLNPDWVEALMGWPVGWTSLEPLPLTEWNPMAPGWPETWEDGLPRVTTGTEQRRNRLKTIGNGWVPQVLAVVLARIAAGETSVTPRRIGGQPCQG